MRRWTSASWVRVATSRSQPGREFIETRPAEVVANIIACLIHQANYLLDQQVRRMEQTLLQEGGRRERMPRARLQTRSQKIP
ncbi:MAG: hypothetical protein KatS3mg111_3277 [Pirellulaceae bacterium]|nr:MAG: hypothetical protein KatS3mg111_3277 [Pirellulaceae bacterium]